MYVTGNSYIRSLTLRNMVWMATSLKGGDYIPLTYLTWAGDYLIWGNRAFGFHLTNILFHSLNAVLVFVLARKLLIDSMRKAPAAQQRWALFCCAAAAMLFSVHPLRVESVAWISERKDLLCGFFFLLTLLAYIRFIERRNVSSYLLSLFLYFAATLSKGSSMVLPAILTLLDCYPYRNLPAKIRAWLDRDYRSIWIEKIPFWLLSLFSIKMTLSARAARPPEPFFSEHSAWERIARAAYGVFFYLGKTMLPLNLSPMFESPPHFDVWQPTFVLCILGCLALGLTLVLMGRRWPALAASAIFFLITLSPTLGLIEYGSDFVACRYSYLACLSWPLLLCGWLARADQLDIPKPIAATVLASAILALSTCTWVQSAIWKDSASLWSAAIRFEPDNWTARHNLGLALAADGKYGDAGAQFLEAIRIRPNHADDWSDLGLTLQARGLPQEGLEDFEQALRLDPRNPYAHNNVGLILLGEGRLAEAVRQFKAALAAEPSFAQANNNLGIALMRLDRKSEAIANFQQALANDPEFSPARENLRMALMQPK